MYFFLLLKNIGTLNTHTIRRIATSGIWSAKGRRWLILREVDLEKDTETFSASHYLTVLGEVGNWDLHASDGQIKGYPVQSHSDDELFSPTLEARLQTMHLLEDESLVHSVAGDAHYQ